MSKKSKPKKKKAAPNKRRPPSMTWFPAFVAGLVLGILIHFIPGMDRVLEQARTPKGVSKEVSKQAPVMWRPQTTR